MDDLGRKDLTFDPDKVERVCAFAELMPHVKGKWSQKKEFIKLQDWQVFILACLFGFIDAEGRRRFRQAYIMLPRKQGKSVLAAVIGLYMLTMDGEAGAEVYCGATSEAQAWEVFRPAKLMAEKAGSEPGEFLSEFGATVAAKSIFTVDGSRFQPVIGKPGDGSSPHCAIIDEYHEHDTPDQFDTMLTGMGAREQPLALVITTAGDNLGGPCFDMQNFAENVLEGRLEDDQMFAIIYTIDIKGNTVLYQSSTAIGRLEEECLRSGALITPRQSPWREAFADLVTRGIIAKTDQLGLSDSALNIQNGAPTPRDCAPLATNSSALTETQPRNGSQSSADANGPSETQSDAAPLSPDGLRKTRPNGKTQNSELITESAWINMKDFTASAEASATSVARNSQFFVSTIAMMRDTYADYSVARATQGLVFSEILKRLYSAHSHMLDAERCQLADCGLEVRYPPDDWRDFAVWRKANPNLGVSVFEDFLMARHQEALNRPAKQGINLTKHLNVWVSSRSAWLNMADWQGCAELVDIEDFAGCEAWIGLDLATKIDVAAMVAKVRMPDGRFAYFPFFYLPEAVVLEARSKNSTAYAAWAASGHLTLTPGDATDFEFIAEDLRKLLRLLDVQQVGFDPYQAHHLAQQMQAEGAPMIEYPMQTRTLSPPMREMEGAIVGKKRIHPGNPMFDWMASNVTAKEDGRGNIYPRKPHGQDHLKIDGITAALMAEGLSMAPDDDGPSVYETRGILAF